MKKDPDGEKGRNVAVTAVRHDEKSASRLDDILQENPLFYPSIAPTLIFSLKARF
jgi:hypothetical protein